MLKNITVSDPYNLTAVPGYTTNSVSNSSIYTQSMLDTVENTPIITDIPTIFTIVSVEICGPKLVRIKYTMANPQLNTLFESGNIYISSGIFGVYNSSDNFYWRNEIIIEVESEECIDKIQPKMKFTNATQ